MEIKYPGGVFDTVQRHSQHMLYHWLKIQAQSCPCFKHYIKSYTICLYAWVAHRNSLIALFYLLHEHVVILLPIFHWLCTVCFVLFLRPKAMDIMVKDVRVRTTLDKGSAWGPMWPCVRTRSQDMCFSKEFIAHCVGFLLLCTFTSLGCLAAMVRSLYCFTVLMSQLGL